VLDILPTFIIPGAEKSGTSYVAHILSQHPDVYIPYIKEPEFFRAVRGGIGHNKGYSYYRRLLAPGRDAKELGDASTAYLWDPSSPQLIAQYVPDVKLIVILRNPVDKTYSHYWEQIKAGCKLPDFGGGLASGDEQIGHLVERSQYDVQLKRYSSLFGREQMLILLYDDLENNRASFFGRICAFLDLSPLPDHVDLRVRVNPSGIPRLQTVARLLSNQKFLNLFRAAPAPLASKMRRVLYSMRKLNFRRGTYPPMDQETRRRLIDVFRPSVAGLAELIHSDLTHWFAMPEMKQEES